MVFKYDPRFIEVNIELSALRDYFEILKQNSEILYGRETKLLQDYRLSNGCTPEDFEWHFSQDNYERKTEFLLPRYIWCPFLVTLYAVLESAMKEAIEKIDSGKSSECKLKGDDFLSQSNDYLDKTLSFSLKKDNELWSRLKLLAALRHAIAHCNGRFESVNKKIKARIEEAIKQDIGVSIVKGYLVVDKEFAYSCLLDVIGSTTNLIETYKKWDDQNRSITTECSRTASG